MSPGDRGRSHPAFRPDPGPSRAGKAAAPTHRALHLPVPWPWPLPTPPAHPWDRDPGPVRHERGRVGRRGLRLAGVALILIGLTAVSYVVANAVAGRLAAQRAQQNLSQEFQQTLAEASTLPTTEDDPTMGTSPSPSITVTTTPGEDIAGPEIRPQVPALVVESPPAAGQALGRIIIPAAQVDWMVVEGVSPDDLAQGPGHMPGTAMPGQPGNAVISGHRTTHGAPFFNLDLLQPGDQITIQTLIGTHTYQVVQTVIVSPTDTWVTNQAPGAWLTLTTCNPKYHSTQRLIVFARLIDGPNAAAITASLTGDETPPQPPNG
jgi:sortase A